MRRVSMGSYSPGTTVQRVQLFTDVEGFQWAPIRPELQEMCRKSFRIASLRQKYPQKTRVKRPLNGPKSSVFCEFFIALCPTSYHPAPGVARPRHE